MGLLKNLTGLIIVLVMAAAALYYIPATVSLFVNETYEKGQLELKSVTPPSGASVSTIKCASPCYKKETNVTIGNRINLNCAEDAVLVSVGESSATFTIYKNQPFSCVTFGTRPV